MNLSLLALSLLALAAGTAGEAVPQPLEGEPGEVFVTVSLALAASGPGDEPVSGRLTVEASGGFRAERLVEAPQDLRFRAPARQSLRVAFEAPGWWTQEQTLWAMGGEAVFLELRPAGALVGELAVPAGRERPRELELWLQEARPKEGARKPALALSELRGSCTLEKGTAFHCKAPAGRFDAQLRADGFASVLLGPISVPAKAKTKLGSISLIPGSSLLGEVRTELGAPPPPGCTLLLEPILLGPSPDARRLSSGSLRAEPNEAGLFHLTGLKPGFYWLTAAHPRYAPTPQLRVEVQEGRETRLLQPVVLEPPVDLEVLLEPTLDSYHRPWQLELSRLAQTRPMTSSARRGSAGEQGRGRMEGLARGSYLLRILNHRGDFRLEKEIELSPGDPPLEITVPLVHVDGMLTLAGEGVSGHLWFGGRGAPHSTHLFSGADGRFHGHLGREGSWPAEVMLAGQSFSVLLDPVEVTFDKETGKAFVELIVPETLLEGRVLDDLGEPVAGARIDVLSLQTRQPITKASSDADGRFELTGLPTSELRVVASFDGEVGEAVEIELKEGSPRQDVLLRVGGGVRISGQVYSDFGPVPRAWVFVGPRGAPGSTKSLSASSRNSGLDGEFEIVVPKEAPSFDLLVLAPGYAARLLRRQVQPGVPLLIPLDTLGGRIEVEIPEGSGSYGDWVLSNAEGARAPLAAFLPWAKALDGHREGGTSLHLPDLETGTYSLCPNGPAVMGGCTVGDLPARGELELTVKTEASKASAGR